MMVAPRAADPWRNHAVAAVRTNPTFVVSAEEQRELLDSFQRRCLHFSEQRTARQLCFNARSCQKTHPDKVGCGGSDSDATLVSPMLLGVCDGASQVDEMGLDAAELPRELLNSCESIVNDRLLAEISKSAKRGNDAYNGPISLLKEAYSDTHSLGSTSVLLAVMDNSTQIHGKIHPMIGVVTLGDCECLMLRRQGDDRRGPLQVVLRTEMQRIAGNSQTPLQLLRMDEDHDPGFTEQDALDAIERGSGLHCTSAYEGDILIMGSDGLFDNLFLNEVVDICNRILGGATSPFEPSDLARLSDIASALVAKAHQKCIMVQGKLPQQTPMGVGGKADDTSVVVAEVVEWTPDRREAWAQSHRRPSPFLKLFSLFSCGDEHCKPCLHKEGHVQWRSDVSDTEQEYPEPAQGGCAIL